MMEIIVILLPIFALIFTIYMLVSPKEQPIFALLATITWFAAAASVIVIEVPYTYVFENSANPDNYIVVEGTQQITSGAPTANYFLGIGMFCMFYLFWIVIQMFYEYVKNWRIRRSRGP